MEENKEPSQAVATPEQPVFKKKSIIREYAESIIIAVLLAMVKCGTALKFLVTV